MATTSQRCRPPRCLVTPLELLLLYRCPDCGVRSGEYLGDDRRHLFGLTHGQGCPLWVNPDDVVEYLFYDAGASA